MMVVAVVILGQQLKTGDAVAEFESLHKLHLFEQVHGATDRLGGAVECNADSSC